ncbi:MAG: FAD-dependent oxidoreductase [Leptolyngbya sp. Prado105]|jgi:hypothetical protein|nr:FAD-dependent oxidoreductase [Leptolyngbya sp. Prado105]
MLDSQFEIAIVGAGMSGLTCAQLLHQAGYKVVVLDKSRGLGGRMATRRLHGTYADHGVCYLKPKSDEFQNLLHHLVDRKVSRVWTQTIHEFVDGQIRASQKSAPCYVSANGISAIAKCLSIGLTLRLNHRVSEIREGWQLHCESGEVISARAVVVAIPAPQAAQLYQLEPLKRVEYSACISAIALYPTERQAEVEALEWKGLGCSDAELGWIGIDSTKQVDPAQPSVVVQSNAAFAARHLEDLELQQVGERLLQRASEVGLPWLTSPELLQVHCWRYAFPITPITEKYLAADTVAPLFFTGDWCGGNRVENAFEAGVATADELNRRLSNRPLNQQFWTQIRTTF